MRYSKKREDFITYNVKGPHSSSFSRRAVEIAMLEHGSEHIFDVHYMFFYINYVTLHYAERQVHLFVAWLHFLVAYKKQKISAMDSKKHPYISGLYI